MLIILRDTREQLPLTFDHCAYVERVEDIGLPFGDYAGMMGNDKDSLTQIPWAVDRKSLGDLYGTMTSGYERWKACMERAKKANHKLVLAIECTYTQVGNGFDHSEFSGEAMLKKLNTLQTKYDLDIWYCSGRREMASRIAGFLSAVERNYSKQTNGGRVEQ